MDACLENLLKNSISQVYTDNLCHKYYLINILVHVSLILLVHSHYTIIQHGITARNLHFSDCRCIPNTSPCIQLELLNTLLSLQFYVITCTRLKKKILINIFKTAHIAYVTGSRIKSQNPKLVKYKTNTDDDRMNALTSRQLTSNQVRVKMK